MADDLIASKALYNKTREEIVAMLQAPTKTTKFRDWDMVYYLGNERGFTSIDSEWLVIRLGNDERVRDYTIVRD
jgi:hypothetical protein